MINEFASNAYPVDIALALRQKWIDDEKPLELLPAQNALVHLIDTMYQSTLLHEEGDAVRVRVVLGEPEAFEADHLLSQSSDAFTLRYDHPCPFTANDLRKLAAAAGFYRAMLGLRINSSRRFEIWGMVITGTRWVNRIDGGRLHGIWLPPNLVIQAIGPGHMIAASGYQRVLESANGRILNEGFDPFHAQWLHRKFLNVRESVMQAAIGSPTPSDQTRICDSFVRSAAQNVTRRLLSQVRSRAHGGSLIYLPEDYCRTEMLDRWFRFRVRFEQSESTIRFHTLMKRLVVEALRVGQRAGLSIVRWEDFEQMQDSTLRELDEALIQYGHFLADLMSVDGALLMDRGFRLIGFGAEILGETPVTTVHRALDLEAMNCVKESAQAGGTRHRSVYRLVHANAEAIGIVISQDGGVRFVANQNGKVTYWPYLP